MLNESALGAQRAADWRKLERVSHLMIVIGGSSGDAKQLGTAYYYLGISYFLRSDARRARDALRAAQQHAAAADDRSTLLRIKLAQSGIAGEIDLDVENLRALSEEALALARELRDEKSTAVALGNIAEAYHLDGDYSRAIRYARDAAARFLRLERWSSAGAQYATIAHVHVLRREFPEARDAMHSAWRYLSREDVALHRAWYFQVWFLFAAALQRWETAAQLYGFITHYRDVNDTPRMQGMLPWLSEPIERHYRELGHERAAELAGEGEGYSIEEAQTLAASV